MILKSFICEPWLSKFLMSKRYHGRNETVHEDFLFELPNLVCGDVNKRIVNERSLGMLNGKTCDCTSLILFIMFCVNIFPRNKMFHCYKYTLLSNFFLIFSFLMKTTARQQVLALICQFGHSTAMWPMI